MASRSRAPIFESELPAGAREAFGVEIERRLEVEHVRDLGFQAWAERVPEARTPLDLRRYRYQLPLYGSRSTSDRELVLKKASQVGASAWSARWVLFWADVRGRTGLYVFPNERVLKDFSDQRINTMIRRSEYLRSRIPSDSVNNKGLKQVGLGWCFAADTMVLTDRGHIPIQDVSVGDCVLTHRGRWRRVQTVHSRMASRTITIRAQGTPGLRTTPEHPLLARRRGARATQGEQTRATSKGAPLWVPASEIGRAYYLGAPLVPIVGHPWPSSKWWVVGRYLADGWVNYHPTKGAQTVSICCAHEEAHELRERLREEFPTLSERTRRTAHEFTICRAAFARELEPFGRLAHGKRLTAEALALNGEKAAALLDGYLSGDGHYVERLGQWTAASTSRALALGIAHLMRRVYGRVASVHRRPPQRGLIEGREVKRRDSYAIVLPRRHNSAFVEGNWGWGLVRGVAGGAQCRVWNLTVEDDASYIADGVVVHNCYFRGSESEAGLESVPADVLVLDEYDKLVAANIGVAEQRVTGPESEGLIRRLGNPSIPGFGIAKLYEGTTQHVWMVKCGACGEQQPMTGSETYTANVDEATARLVCRKCRRGLDITAGEWVATYPDRETMGLWISKFVVPGIDLRRVIANHHKTHPADIQTHFNRDLGEEYAPSEGRLSRRALERATRPGEIHLQESLTSFNLKTMGIDVATARACNVRISEHLDDYRKRAVWIGTVDANDASDERWVERMADKLMELAERFEVNMIAIDHLPEGRLANSLIARLPGRCYKVAYNTAKNPTKLWDVDDDEMRATVARTFAIDATLDSFRTQRNLIPDLAELPSDYPDHMGSLVRIVERDEKDKVVVFYRSTGPDDFAQAEVYDLVATELYHHAVGVAAVREAEVSPEPTREPDEDPLTDEPGEGGLPEGDWDGGKDYG